MLLEGLQLPLTTPFYSDGRLNVHKLEHNVERYSKTPVAGLVALSGDGESTMLSDEETRQALRSVVDAASPDKVLLAGVARDSVLGTLDMVEYAAGVGYDAVLVRPPDLFSSSAERAKGLLTYFRAVADRSALPVVLYSVGSSLPAEIVVELAGHPQLIGLVDDAGDRERIAELKRATASVKREVTVTQVFAAVTGRMKARNESAGPGLISANSLSGGDASVAIASLKPAVKTRTKVVGFQLLSAHTNGMLDDLLAGAVGTMPAFAASAPQVSYEVYAVWKDGDEGLAREKQIRLREAAARVEIGLGVAGIKYGCDLNGYYGGWPRLPLLALTGAERAEVEALMQGLRN
jgi:4-hydroxy-2-oxoglutarate aldolase